MPTGGVKPIAKALCQLLTFTVTWQEINSCWSTANFKDIFCYGLLINIWTCKGAHDTSGQQEDSDLNTASLSLVYTAMVPVRVDTNTPRRIQDFTGAPVADTKVTAALDWSKLSCQRGCLNHPPTLVPTPGAHQLCPAVEETMRHQFPFAVIGPSRAGPRVATGAAPVAVPTPGIQSTVHPPSSRIEP